MGMTSMYGIISIPYKFDTNYIKFAENLMVLVIDKSRLLHNGEYIMNSSLFINEY